MKTACLVQIVQNFVVQGEESKEPAAVVSRFEDEGADFTKNIKEPFESQR